MTWRVDWRATAALLGTVIKYLSLTMVVPLIVSVVYMEDVVVFVVSIAITAAVGLALERLDPDPDLGPREALLLVSAAWMGVSVLGTIPYLLGGLGSESTVGLSLESASAAFSSIVNALFESTSGFTTTGATVLGQIGPEHDQHSHALMMWRQLTQWLGGMGIIVLMIAILPELAVNGAQLMESEAPGPELQKLTPKIAETARALWLIYFGFTVFYICLLYGLSLTGAIPGVDNLAPNMDFYNAVAHGFTTLPTGGFSPKADSIGAFSAAVQWVVIPFIVVAGVNFALFWHVLKGEARVMLENREFQVYTGATAVLVAILGVLLVGGAAPTTAPGGATGGLTENTIRQSVFQIVTLLNSTGYATADFAQWGTNTQMLLLFAMFIGGSAGSTGGGIKVVRWILTVKAIRRELYTTAHPETVKPVRLGGRVVDEGAVRAVLVFTMLYLMLMTVSAVLIALDPGHAIDSELTTLEALSASLATIGNIGPGFGRLGPFGNYLFFSDASKLLMIFLMWIGRLEIVPVLAVFVSGLTESR